MTAAERLVLLSGLSGVAASVHLMSLGAGTTAGTRLLDYSSLESATAGQHLMSDGGGVASLSPDYILFARRMCRR